MKNATELGTKQDDDVRRRGNNTLKTLEIRK
jgi:hypothetical protein